MITERTVRTAARAIHATARTIEHNDALWRFLVTTFLLAMAFLAYEAAGVLQFLLTAWRR